MSTDARPRITVELHESEKASSIVSGLLRDHVIDGVVHTDLPMISRWSDLKKLTSNLASVSKDMTRNHPTASQLDVDAIQRGFRVKTIGAQVRTKSYIRSMIVETARDPTVDAVLFVSGGSLLRRIPGIPKLDSIRAISMMKEMQMQGTVRANIELWAVANPNLRGTRASLELDRLKHKVQAGATTIVTQPILIPDRGVQFFRDANHMMAGLNVVEPIRWNVGMPILSSMQVLRFWFFLTELDVATDPEVAKLLRRVETLVTDISRDKSTGSKNANGYTIASAEWRLARSVLNSEVAQISRSQPHIDSSIGMHVMPLLNGYQHIQSLLGMESS